MRILAVDVGSGTQDILVYDDSLSVENNVQLVLPSATVMVARRIMEATRKRQHVFLSGYLMGGGPSTSAVKAHLAAGLKVYSTPNAAKTLFDDLDKVRSLGVNIVEDESLVPSQAVRISTGDVDIKLLKNVLDNFGVDLPEIKAVAIQDHGEAPKGFSDRKFRFQQWEKFLNDGGELTRLLYRSVPPYLTRMQAVKAALGEVMLMDTAAAAIWGATCDDVVVEAMEKGPIAMLNVGNSHTVGAIIQERKIVALFEHHTSLMTPDKVRQYIERLRQGELRNEDVFNDGGHGSAISKEFRPTSKGLFVSVTGPRRALVRNLGYYMASPYGNMMLAGCFGLVQAIKASCSLNG